MDKSRQLSEGGGRWQKRRVEKEEGAEEEARDPE